MAIKESIVQIRENEIEGRSATVEMQPAEERLRHFDPDGPRVRCPIAKFVFRELLKQRIPPLDTGMHCEALIEAKNVATFLRPITLSFHVCLFSAT